MLGGDRVELLHLLGDHRRERAAPFVGAPEDVVGQDVELLLALALRVRGSRFAERAAERALAEERGAALAAEAHVVQQRSEAAAGAGRLALLADQELGKGL